MSRRRRGERLVLNAEINVVSLIDVMMLLMVIFMITAPMMQGGVDVALPQAAARPLESKSGLVVTVDRAGDVFVDQDRMTFAEFRGAIKAITAARGKDGVYLRADKGVPYGRVVQVLAAIRASGTNDVGLVAEPDDAAGQ